MRNGGDTKRAVETSVITEIGRKYLRLHLTEDVGPVRLGKLLDHFGTIEAVLRGSRAAFRAVDGIGPRTVESLFQARDDDRVQREVDQAQSMGVRIVCLEDDVYPALLKRIPDPPACLYLRGSLTSTDAVAVAIVGSRRCSHYGQEQARRFAEGLGRAGFTIISGLARGIDSIAHRASLDVGGRTIGVLGNGLSRVYPPENAPLAEELTRSGALISELAMDQSPNAKNFPPRNRIIAGLSLGVLVIEAGRRSGALITARLGADYNREVFALPGRVDQPAYAGGTNGMIRDSWARAVTSVEDILDDLSDVGRIMREELATPSAKTDALAPGQAAEPLSVPTTAVPLSADEQRVYAGLASDAMALEPLCDQVGLEPSRVIAILTGLQLKGVVRRLPGCLYERRHV